MSAKTSFLQKTLLVVFSCFVTLLILEIVLRTGGFCMAILQEYHNRRKIAEKDTIRVMCIGESTTALGGENSYPSQLEKILNQDGTDKKFRVINKGVPMTNTAVIARKIDGWLKAYQPDAVVAMMGINDHNKLVPLDRSAYEGNRFLSFFQTYKFFRWLWNRWVFRDHSLTMNTRKKLSWIETKKAIKEKHSVGRMIQLSDRLESRSLARAVLKQLRALSEWVPDNEDMYIALGNVLIKYHWFDDLPEVIDYFLDRNHHHRWLYDEIAEGCRDADFRQIIVQHLNARIAAAPEVWTMYEFLGTCYAMSGKAQEAGKNFALAEDYRRRVIDPVTQENYVRIVQAVNDYGAGMILVQYPMRDVEGLKVLLKQDLDVDRLVFVDNQKTFQDRVAREGYDEYFSDRFGGDFGHCTAKGNAVLASNVARAVGGLLTGKKDGEDDQ